LAQPALVLLTDETSTYPRLARAVCGQERLLHRRTRAKLARDTWNPLFAIHHTEAMARDHRGRPCRESWLASKQRRYLDLALQLWMTYRNHVRRRFNCDEESPAQDPSGRPGAVDDFFDDPKRTGTGKPGSSPGLARESVNREDSILAAGAARRRERSPAAEAGRQWARGG